MVLDNPQLPPSKKEEPTGRRRTFPLSTADWGRGMLQPRSSEHHELDVLPGENRACRDECVAADDEVLREGLDVA